MSILYNSFGVEYQIAAMPCSWGFHAGSKYFIYKGKLAFKLAYIAKKLDLDVEMLSKTTFKFSAPKKGSLKRFIFKLCRYVRNDSLQSIIGVIYKAIKAGVDPSIAIFLGHKYFSHILYYARTMDIVLFPNAIPFNVVTKAELLLYLKTKNYINGIYKGKELFLKSDNQKICILLREKKYKDAETFLISIINNNARKNKQPTS